MPETEEEDRRKTVGRRIKRARRRAGHRSQKAFAAAIDMAESSVARAETGDPRVGAATFEAIEDGLEWPEGSIASYLETGDEAVFTSGPTRAAEPPDELRDDTERKLWAITELPPDARWSYVLQWRAMQQTGPGRQSQAG